MHHLYRLRGIRHQPSQHRRNPIENQQDSLRHETIQLWNMLGVPKGSSGVKFGTVTVHEHGMVEGAAPYRGSDKNGVKQQKDEEKRQVKFGFCQQL